MNKLAHLRKHSSHAVIRCASKVDPEPVRWLWPGRIALGKLTLIAGDPGLGKSLLSISLAHHITRGLPWPMERSPCPEGEVILLSAEDDASDTLRPRLDAAGADPDKVFLFEAVNVPGDDGSSERRGFSLKQDLPVVEEVLIGQPQCRLIVVDPISAYLDGADSHNNSDIRSLLAPLADMASRRRVAVIGITHLNKGGQGSAMYRTTGSLAFVAAARAVYAVIKDKDDPDRRLFLPVKNNLGPDKTGFAYRTAQADNGAAVLEWEPDPVETTADEAMVRLEDENRTERDQAREWLRKRLGAGPVAAAEVIRDAAGCDIAKRTLDRAKRDLGVVTRKESFCGSWQWSLSQDCCTEDSQSCS